MTRDVLTAAITAAVFTTAMSAATFTPSAAAAATKKCPEPKGAVISKYGKFTDASKLAAMIAAPGVQNDIRKIPFIGKPISDGFFKNLKNLPYKDSKKFGKYLEYTKGKDTMTVFNVGDYAGAARWIVAYSHNGVLKTPLSGGTGIWKYFPGMELHHPVIMFRLFTGAGSVTTPQIPGGQLKNLPGNLGIVANKAAQVTRTLRVPLGALMIAGWKPTGALAQKMDLIGLPPGKVYIMAGAGIEMWTPGSTEIGKPKVGTCNTDPLMASYMNMSTLGKDDNPANRGEEFKDPRKMLPEMKGYLKISVPGKWMNPMYMFERRSYAEDAVLMFTKDLDFASWGTVRNFVGKDFVYGIDLPGILDVAKAGQLKLPDIGIGFSIKELNLADAVNLKVHMMTKFLDPVWLQKLSKLAGMTGDNKGKWAQNSFGQPYNHVVKVRDAIAKGLKVLPLDQIKIKNEAFVDYDAKTQSYPPSDSFNLYFSAGDGITATGERGPIMVTNGTFEMFGEKLAKTRAVLSPKTGIKVFTEIGTSANLGKVLGAELRLSGKDITDIELTQNLQKFEKRQNWNILGIAKGQSRLAYYLQDLRPRMHVLYDPTSGCAPPIPIKVDADVAMPITSAELKSQILDLLNGAKYDSGGITKCADRVIQWAKTGAKYLGKGAVIGGKYVAEGANYAAKYGAEGAKYTAKYAGVAGSEITKGYNTVANVTGNLGTKQVANFAGSTANAMKEVAGKVGCALGIKCSRSSAPPIEAAPKFVKRAPSPFNCPAGTYYSAEFGQCWNDGAANYVYTGTPTASPQCVTAARIQGSGNNPQAFLSKCTGSATQQFRTAEQKGAKPYLSYQQNLSSGSHRYTECLTGAGAKFAPMTALVSASGGACGKAPKIAYDRLGRLIATKGGVSLCVRPDHTSAHAATQGHLADWIGLGGNGLDITTDQGGFGHSVAAYDGTAWTLHHPGDWRKIAGSPTGMVRLDGGAKGEIWGVGKSGSVHHFDGTWKKVKGTLSDIGVGGKDGKSVWGISTSKENGEGNSIWQRDAKTGNWAKIPGAAVRIDVDGAGVAWGIQKSGKVWYRDVARQRWVKVADVPGGAADISAGKTGTVMVATKRGEIYVLAGSKWQKFPGLATSIAVDPDGSPWAQVDIGTGKGVGYVHKSAPRAKYFKSVAPTNAFDAKATKVNGGRLVLDHCDPAPVAKTWGKIAPKHPGDFAKQAGMDKPFRLEHENYHGTGARRAVGFVGTYQWQGRTQAVAQPLPLDQVGRQEMVAVFKDDAKKFAMYNKALGLCMTDQKGAGESRFALFEPCTFSSRQLWTRKAGRTKGRYFLHNVHTNRCLAPSVTTFNKGGFVGGFAGVEGVTPLKNMSVHYAEPHWDACNPNKVPGWHMATYTPQLTDKKWWPASQFNISPVVQLQVQKGLMCVDATTSNNNGATTVAWHCIRGQNNQEFQVNSLGNGLFELKSRRNGKCLGIKQGSLNYGAAVDQWGCSNVPHQRWKIQDHGYGWFQLINYRTGACLGLGRKIASNGEHMTVNRCKREPHMFFRIAN